MVAAMKFHETPVDTVGRYIDSPDWAMEQKLDGIRCLAVIDDDGHVELLNHGGSPLRAGTRHHAALVDALAAARGVTVDGELMPDGTLWLFDILAIPGHDLRSHPFATRRSVLETLAPHLPPLVGIVPSYTDPADKARLWADVVLGGYEGVMVKRLTGRYIPGRTRDVLKVKLTSTLDLVVLGPSLDGSASVRVGVVGPTTELGACSTIGKPHLRTGDVVEVEYQHVTDDAAPRLVQARIVRVRPDKTAADCKLAGLRVRQLGAVARRETIPA